MENVLMARFDVFCNPGEHSSTTPFLLNVQADFLEGLDTCVVIPLRRLQSYAPVRMPEDLVPIFTVQGVECLLETPKLAAVPRRVLKKPVDNLKHDQLRIVTAMERLFNGF